MPAKPSAKTDTRSQKKTLTSTPPKEAVSVTSAVKKTNAGSTYPKRTSWTCDVCHTSVVTFVRVKEAPQHICRKQRNQYLPMTLKGEQQ